jgi:hypothetical protein
MAAKKKSKSAKKPSFTTCPTGHKLPRAGCTPLKCRSGERLAVADVAEADPTSVAARALAKKPHAEALEAEFEEQNAAAEVAFQLRARRLGLPPDLDEEASEEWAENRLNKLRAVAVADMEWDLRYGDAQARREARRDLLSATGMRNREQLGNITPSIVVNIGQGADAPGWLQRAAQREMLPATAQSGEEKKE